MPTASSILHGSNPTVKLLEENECVVIDPRVSLVSCQVLMQQLFVSVNPLQTCNDNGKGLYSETIHIVGQHLLDSCDECCT